MERRREGKMDGMVGEFQTTKKGGRNGDANTWHVIRLASVPDPLYNVPC